MITVQQIVLACWLIFLPYWFISAGSAKPVQETKGWLGGNWYQLFVLVGFLLIMNPMGLARVNPAAVRMIPSVLFVNFAAVMLAVAGLMVAIMARRRLAGNWSREVAIKQDHELITTGLYRYIRHPIYSGILLMVLGTALSFGTLSAGIGFLVVLLTIWLKSRAEEDILAKRFFEEYPSYKKRTKALVPFVW